MTSPIGGLDALAGLAGGGTGAGTGGSGLDGLAGAGGIGRPTPPSPPSPAGGGSGLEGPSFAEGLRAVEGLQAQTSTAATGLATGELTDVHQYTVAAAKSSLAVELTAALRNRAVEAYQEIMRMQV